MHRACLPSRGGPAPIYANLRSKELSPYCRNGNSSAQIEGPSLLLPPELAQAMAMALHELATNAVKYGALSTPTGRVTVEWSTQPGQKLYLRWIETGGPPVAPPTKEGFGTRAILRLIGQLSGEVKYDWHAARRRLRHFD